MYASDEGNAELVEALLNREDADINAKDASGRTALMLAVMMGHVKVVKSLLKHSGIDLSIADDEDNGILFYAAKHGRIRVLKALLEKANRYINAQKKKTGETPLIYAIEKRKYPIAMCLLQQEGIIASIQDGNKRTALMLAAQSGRLEVVEALLEREDAAINAKDASGRTALIEACTAFVNSSTDVALALLNTGKCKLDLKDSRGWTALMYASDKGNAELVGKLLDKGANQNLENRDKKSAADLAEEFPQVLKQLSRKRKTPPS